MVTLDEEIKIPSSTDLAAKKGALDGDAWRAIAAIQDFLYAGFDPEPPQNKKILFMRTVVYGRRF